MSAIVEIAWLLEDDAGDVHDVVVRGLVTSDRVIGFECLDAKSGAAIAMRDDDRARAEQDLIAELKICSCGRSWSTAEWKTLPFIGFMDDGEGGRLELRNCTCHSTLAIVAEAA